TLLLETDSPVYEGVRDSLAGFAELVKSPEHIHTYKISPLSLWNAASAGLTRKYILAVLTKYSRYEIPENIILDIEDTIGRYGKVKLIKKEEECYLFSEDELLITEIVNNSKVKPFLVHQVDHHYIKINRNFRGHVKQKLLELGFPVEDLAGYKEGAPLAVELRQKTHLTHREFHLRKYQTEAADIFYAGNTLKGGSGVIVLPCGAGKTIVGLRIMSMLNTETLILVTNITAARQWIEEIIDKTGVTKDQVGEYSGEVKELKPITIATYQILVYRKKKQEDFIHFNIFNKKNWGLIIYDEVHLLPAPLFRMVAELQSMKRLGLTATLIREDGKQGDVFSLIGPKKYDVPWKELEKQGWIAKAVCYEIRVDMNRALRYKYAVAGSKEQFRIASTNPLKMDIIRAIVQEHKNDNVLVIGQYIDQLQEIARDLNAPLIYGKTKNRDREDLYRQFKEGTIKVLIVSKVANFAVDLPDANVAVQVSGTFGSRQEEAQRLGRILRPKSENNQAFFYSIITKESCEQIFAFKRQLFLVEQGYKYVIKDQIK
ncbi:MAG: DEAD/DEAH box helicase, partial [bacterium]|nr:DEAD/DEAH box helicase [bacterium]